jgi:hypothetical protein
MTDDPFKLRRWTLAQALAWIIHRTPEAVLETPMNMDVLDVADEAARLSVDKDREEEERARPADDFRPADKFRPDRFKRDELRGRLMDGTLTAYGIKRGQAEHSPIPNTSWETIDSFYVVGFGPSDVGSSREKTRRYRDVFVRPSDVLPDWPAAEGGDIGREKRAKGGTRQAPLAERIAAELREMFPGGRPPKKVKEIDRALKGRPNVGGFSRRTLEAAINRAWPRSRQRTA